MTRALVPFFALLLAGRVAAQGVPPVVSAPVVVPADSVPPFERPNGALMRPVSLTYQLSLTRSSGQVMALGTRSVSVSEATVAGTPGWLVAESRRGAAVETTDSVYLARADLAPERWTSTIGRAQLGASFSRDSIFGALDTYQGRASFALSLPANALLSAGMVERIVELLPLRTGYRSTATLLLIDGAEPRLMAAELAVAREERVAAGSTSVDCWLVALRFGALEERLWVSKDQSRVVRTEQAVADGLLVATLLQ